MTDDGIPDPTELRAKLGIAPRPFQPPSIDHYQPPSDGTIQHLRKEFNENRALTLADFEPEPRTIDEAESQKIDELLKDCPPASARWLKKYLVLGNKSAAARAINYSAGVVVAWQKAHPKFAHLLQFYEGEVRLRWNEVSERRALEGFKDEVFKPDGSLKYTRMRQDPQFLVQQMKRLDPEWNQEQAGTNIVINVIREEE